MFLGVFVALGLMWRSPAMSHWLDPRVLSRQGHELLDRPLGPLMVLGAYVVAVALAIPSGVMATVGVVVFGPWQGLAYSLCGMLIGGVVTYGIGRLGGPPLLRRLGHAGGSPLAERLRHKGLWAVILTRALPVAPFLLINITAGALRVRLQDFVVGTFIGLLPGTIMVALFLDRLSAAWRSPGAGTYMALAVGVVLLGTLAWWLRRRLKAVEAAQA
ncbi:MAG: TVP38/TMEM64 family protein [Burkholderiales bacterium]|nr:TVP38/TMEM64 family protein [Burkholderiales bacterium]